MRSVSSDLTREPSPQIPPCWSAEPRVTSKGGRGSGGWSAHWEELGGTPRFFRAQANEYVSNLDSAIVLNPRACVLDFGCGFGFVAQILAPKVGELFLWEASANMRRHTRLNVASHQNVRFLDLSKPEAVCGDLRFDLILVNSVVQYMSIDELSLWINRWRTMLSPGGRIIVSDVIPPDHDSISDIVDLLKFSLRRGVLVDVICRLFLKLWRYWKVRRSWPLARISREQLSQLAKPASLTVTCLPRNLTQFRTRFTAILTERTSIR
jgi:SAM-dependent methyltransferase